MDTDYQRHARHGVFYYRMAYRGQPTDVLTALRNGIDIGIEICMNSNGDLLKATDNATELTAMLCKAYGISVRNVVQHNNWSGKNCPQLIRAGKPYNWDTFIAKVTAAMTREAKDEAAMPTQEMPVLTQEQFSAMADSYFAELAGRAESDWSKREGFWEKAVAMGIMDGTRPRSVVSREEFAAVLGRLGLLGE